MHELDKFGVMVKYDSRLNEQQFTNFKAKELDLFFSIISKMKDNNSDSVTYTFDELRELSQYNQNTGFERFKEDIDIVYDKIINLTVQFDVKPEEIPDDFKDKFPDKPGNLKFNIFSDRFFPDDNSGVTIWLNSKYRFLLNDLTRYTKFEIQEFSSLKSIYAKNMYRILKQFHRLSPTNYQDTKAEVYMPVEKLRKVLDIPKSYEIYNINQKVIGPIMEELSPIFRNLEVIKVKGKGKYKRRVVQYIFTFDKYAEGSWMQDRIAGKEKPATREEAIARAQEEYKYNIKRVEKTKPQIKNHKGQITAEDYVKGK